MRTLSPAYLATAVAIALGSTAALAQLQISRTSTPTAASTTTGTPDATPSAVVVPGIGFGGSTGVIADTGSGVNVNGERIGGAEVRTGVSTTTAANTPTPNFELTARQGAEREARRRARGEEPRIYGIAPRTERDLTHQMPDDPIIRY
jgi:hypothetical protein